MDIIDILNELNTSNSTSHKLAVLEKNKDNFTLKMIFKLAYDKVTYTYGVTSKTVKNFSEKNALTQMEILGLNQDNFPYECIEDLLVALSERKYTGHNALAICKYVAMNCDPEIEKLFYKLLDRDLKVNISEKSINKIWKGLIPKPNYNRCDIFNQQTSKNVEFPAYLQLKCDGTYREAFVKGYQVTFKTRSGEPAENPIIAEQMKGFPNGYYLGEFTIGHASNPDMNRSESNGLINSKNPPYSQIVFTIWDYLTEEEYTLKTKVPYNERFQNLIYILNNAITPNVDLVPSKVVNSVDEALAATSAFMNQGLEGGVLKAFNMQFKNGTSKQQLKIKLKVDCDLRITGFTEGTGKRTNYIGAITFSSDDGKIKGQCSGFNDTEMKEFSMNKDKYIGKIIAIEFNDLCKAENNDYYALMHPRFIEVRNDKTESDTLERVIALRDMARSL